MVEKSEEFLYSVWEDHTNTGIANVRNRREDQELKGRTDQPREHWWKCIEVPKGPIGLGTICVKGMKRSLKELVNRCAFMSHILEKRPDHSCLDKLLELLPEDQELAISCGVPFKILAHPNDAIEKVCGSEHSRRVRGLGGNVW
ncbi:hypothetical protein FXO38_20691 [Capsicum annuum]|nr:uncharacterized protein LOC107863440 isoform X1 [Capsicum annuum]XP_047264501.1 uncharacterized protein LOC107863440 isoform X1 [Capsicum annuum]XP_047264502.1 uncharacterized protein LOC107863440 isoform X1 [Capsicum annuum]XP_047264503.1 uncharacterized protein LOC107863440 isoform X1 [Capsicum annuum]XP_047264504.1 uncharacterized protein LOC107863440 isoform X1 [Capsicum annuum]XP_047264505.1 uncharacterized protein LOC107863440 isoform X1 [Capsicum annuum]KAF3643312.1 hypothetical pro